MHVRIFFPVIAGSISTDIGEGSGRNAGAAVTGFVNGLCIWFCEMIKSDVTNFRKYF